MRAYQIDELTPEDVRKIDEALADRGLAGPISGIHYLPVPDDLLSAEQRGHLPRCGPYFLPLETGDGWIRLEFLVRARSILRCSCIAYASPGIRSHMTAWLDALLAELGITA